MISMAEGESIPSIGNQHEDATAVAIGAGDDDNESRKRTMEINTPLRLDDENNCRL